ncbi:putative membrane protein [Elusimicrobium simillimum]|uniref:DUF2207 domain-containing protein n=1 Tax=Elusimicrobium simillimum TaxID=3143438 RepID=UPI003C70340F
MRKLALILTLFISTALSAQEYIQTFQSDIKVNTDGSANVTETIKLNVEHVNIRRGIIRDLPLKYKHSRLMDGGLKYKINSLTMDGARHPFFIEREGAFIAVNFGDDDYISKGMHTYVLNYTVTNTVGFHKDFDELYFNVTGNAWNFSIKNAAVSIKLPEGAEVIERDISVYTGPRGNTHGNYLRTGSLSFQATQPLPPGSGLTVAIPFYKGIIKEPSFKEKSTMLLMANIKGALAFLLLICSIIYFRIAHKKIWRPYKQRPIIAAYEPPPGMSAGYTRFIAKRCADMTTLSTIITSLAVKGAVEIFDKKITLKNPDAPMLSSDEKAALNIMFKQNIELDIAEKSWPTFERVNNAIEADYKTKENKQLFTSVFTTYSMQILVAIVMGIILAFLSSFSNSYVVVDPPVIFFIVYVFAAVIFMNTLPKYTLAGWDVKYDLDCFAHYLEIGEGGRIRESDLRANAEVYCDYLPYAIALDMESKWHKHFEPILKSAEVQEVVNRRGIGKNVGRGLVSYGIYSSLRKARSSYINAQNRSSGSSSGGWSSGRGSGGGGRSGGGRGGGGGRGR